MTLQIEWCNQIFEILIIYRVIADSNVIFHENTSFWGVKNTTKKGSQSIIMLILCGTRPELSIKLKKCWNTHQKFLFLHFFPKKTYFFMDVIKKTIDHVWTLGISINSCCIDYWGPITYIGDSGEFCITSLVVYRPYKSGVFIRKSNLNRP